MLSRLAILMSSTPRHGGGVVIIEAGQPPAAPAPVSWPDPVGGDDIAISWPATDTLPGSAGSDLLWPDPEGGTGGIIIALPGEPDSAPNPGDGGGDDTQPGGTGGDDYPAPDLTPAPDSAVGALVSAAGITIIGRLIETGALISSAGLTVIQRSSE